MGGILASACLAALMCAGSAVAFPNAAPVETELTLEQAAQGIEKPLPEDIPSAWDQAVVAIAQSQLGATESADGVTPYGTITEDLSWNALFAQFCLNEAGVTGMPQEADPTAWATALSAEDVALYASADSAEATAGQIAFLDLDADEANSIDTVAVVSEVTPATDETPAQVELVLATEGEVREATYDAADAVLVGYGALPEQGAEEAEDGTVALNDTLTYETERYNVRVSVSGEATLAPAEEDAVAEATDEGLAMNVTELGEDSAEYQAAQTYATTDESAGELVSIDALSLSFTYEGRALDVSACEVTAQITPADSLQGAANAMEGSEEIADEAAAGIEVAALQTSEDGTAQELDETLVQKGEKNASTMNVTLNAARPAVQMVARETLNPHFTVQYYGWLDMLVTKDDGYLEIIDTSNGGNNQGGNLPENGKDPKTTGLYVNDQSAGEDYGTLLSEMRLKQLFEQNEYDYFEAPSLPYVNIFRGNGNYRVYEVWVLEEGKDPASTNENDWDVHKNIVNATDLHFTNNPDKAGDKTILIEDGTVIRMVATQTTGGYENDVVFYDYDITEDRKTTATGSHPTQTNYGINNPRNYANDGRPKLAFGNANTGTGLHDQTWRGNTPNQYNRSGGSFNGCTFGLVTGLDENGHIIYASDLDAPNLFDKGSATGKTTYGNKEFSLNFDRTGDTYTLTSVGGSGVENLDHFNNPTTGNITYGHIWTNNFWPMDNVKNADGNTGEFSGTYNQYDNPVSKEQLSGVNGVEQYPCSDDGIAHNNMFGMQYSLQFKLTEDYVGPLEYYFFGDDDMWVFLDGRLVCDIGGTHSSVGAYVNLWDYLEKGSAGTHTLKFYYTERGLSGSTCYMQFTLPSVSSVEPEYQNGQLRVEKEVVGVTDPNLEFDFEIEISSKDGMVQGSDYSIVRHKADGTEESTLLTDGKGTFKLAADEYVTIDYLQYGTHYKITETSTGGLVASNTINGGNPTQSATAEGDTIVGKDNIVIFTNTAMPKLPNTGGPGTWALSAGGVTLLIAGAGYGVLRRERITR